MLDRALQLADQQQALGRVVVVLRAVQDGQVPGPDGKVLPPTGKSFEVDFCTVARWDEDGQIVEENLFYDVVGMMKQIGLG